MPEPSQQRLAEHSEKSETATRELADARSHAENLTGRVGDLDRQLLLQSKEAEMLSARVGDLESRLALQGKILAEREYENGLLRKQVEVATQAEQALREELATGAKSPAVEKLRVRTILILGHGRCGGVAAALDDSQTHGIFIDGWIDLLSTARERLPKKCDDVHGALERENISVSLERLMGFPFVAQAVQDGRLTLQGGLFDIADGRLELLDPKTGAFNPIEDGATDGGG